MAKKFVPRQRKHKVIARQRAQENARHEVSDSNQYELSTQPSELEQKKAELRESLRQDGAKMGGKKAKRLEKYIDSKLRKDETRDLLAKLAERKVDTSLFSSSKALGQGRKTKKQELAQALREERAGLGEAQSREDVLFERRSAPSSTVAKTESGDEDSDGGASLSNDITSGDDQAKDIVSADGAKPSSVMREAPTTKLGSGLKRPLEIDDEGQPKIPKRQKRGGIKSKTSAVSSLPSAENNEYEEWGGFASDSDEDKGSLEESSADSSDSEKPHHESDQSSPESSEDDASDIEESEKQGDAGEGKAARSSAFKAWAHQVRNEALGYKPVDSSEAPSAVPKIDNFVPRAPEQDPLPAELQSTSNEARKAFSVSVTRTPEIQEARLKLPVVTEEQKIMEAIHNHNVVVVCGSTGSGKTTQVPQFLFEAGYGNPDSPTPGMIGITQPRRVAAVSMSRRVGEELGDRSGAVAYQIRFEGTVGSKTAVKFMTDGVLLKEVAQDITLQKYSAIIVDEAHERSINTDILVGMLSRVVKLRAELAEEDAKVKPLKLIIMSATLRIEDLTKNPRLFPIPPPVLEVEGRQHPVTIHFARKTHHDYVDEAFRKISRGHRKLPPGGFLVFLTGRDEIVQLTKRLKSEFGGLKTADSAKVQISASEAPMEAEDIEFGDFDDFREHEVDDISLDDDDEENDEDEQFQIEDDQEVAPLKTQILPLYSLLPTREQLRIFEAPPEGTRQIILATNVAETSLTIPGIRYVFDCGRSKERRYDKISGVQSFEIGWISKASANQRSGRAGRTGPGHCYRLYSSAVYERDCPPFTDPELLRMPIEGVVLQLKAMNLQHVVNFPFPTPPDRQSLAKAERLLSYISAISSSGQVSTIGSLMSVFPLSPRFARILLAGHFHDCLPYTVAMVAGLSAGEIFAPENQAIPALAAKDDGSVRTTADVLAEDRRANVKKLFNQVHKNFCYLDDKSDAIKVLQVVGEFAHEPTDQWCEGHFVHFKVLKEIQQMRQQITKLLSLNIPAFKSLTYQEKLDAPSEKQVVALKQMVAAGFIDQVAIRADLAPVPPEQYRKPRRAIDVPYMPLIPLGSPQHQDGEGLVYIHPTSPLAHLSTQECPQYVIYAYLQRAAPSGLDPEKKPKTRMQALTDITGTQLANLAKGTPLLTYGKPIKEVKSSVASGGILVRECWVVPYLRAEGTGGQGWPLPSKKVTQRKVPGKGWVVE